MGGGISGALVADALVQAGLSVAALDRRGPVRGSTAASTALLQFELDQPLTLLIRKVGRERAVRAYWRSAAAVGYLRHRVEDLGIRCGFKERETVYLPGNVLDTDGARGRGAGAGRGRAPLPLHRSRRAADPHRHRAPGCHPFGWCGGGEPGATRGGAVAVGDRSRLPHARPGRGARDREHPSQRDPRHRHRPRGPGQACRVRDRVRAGRSGAAERLQGHLDLGDGDRACSPIGSGHRAA